MQLLSLDAIRSLVALAAVAAGFLFQWGVSLEWEAIRLLARLAGTPLACNADMGPAEIRTYCRLDAAGQQLMRSAMQQLGLTARAFHRILKLARTIADLAGSEQIQPPHLAEAIQYRPRQVL